MKIGENDKKIEKNPFFHFWGHKKSDVLMLTIFHPMSEEDSINSDNAEDHGLEVFETSTGDRCFLNPGNDFVYGRDGTFLGTRQEMEPHKERQRVIITRLNRWLTMPSDGTHMCVYSVHCTV